MFLLDYTICFVLLLCLYRNVKESDIFDILEGLKYLSDSPEVENIIDTTITSRLANKFRVSRVFTLSSETCAEALATFHKRSADSSGSRELLMSLVPFVTRRSTLIPPMSQEHIRIAYTIIDSYILIWATSILNGYGDLFFNSFSPNTSFYVFVIFRNMSMESFIA